MKPYKEYKYAKMSTYVKKIKAVNLLGGKCICCGEDNMFKLCFHHKNRTEKKHKISDIRNYSWKKIKEEVVKCILVCHNCHTELHDSEKETTVMRCKNNKKVLLEFVGEKRCSVCGYDKNNNALVFHHKDKNKEFQISRTTKTFKSLYDLEDSFVEEINKCDILCKNCHTLEHSDYNWFLNNKKEIYNMVKTYKTIQGKIDRKKVYKLFDEGIKQSDIAKSLNASQGTISDILKPYKKSKIGE